MADIKVVNLQINTNIDTASKEFDDLAKSIKVVNTAATNLDATFEEVYGDLQPLTTRMGEAEDRLYELALAGKQGTKEFKDLLATVGNYRKTQIQTDMVVDAAATTLGQKLTGSLNAAAGGFALVQGSMALFGTESEDVEQAILKVQSAMAISQGVETIREGAKSVQALGSAIRATTIFQKAAAAAQYVWNAAMAANPLGALVVTISALLVGGYKLIKFFQDSSAANEKAATSTRKNTAALKEQSLTASQSYNRLKSYNDQQYALAQATGASGEELRKLALKHKEEEIALNKKNAVLAQSTFLRERDTLASLKNADASDEVIANQEKLVQSTYASFKKQNELLSTSYKERAALRKANEVAEVAENKTKLDEITTKNKEAYNKRLEDQKEAALKAKEQRIKDAQEERDFFIGIDNANRERRVSEALEKEAADIKFADTIAAEADRLILEEETNKKRSLDKIAREKAEADAKTAIRMKALDDLTSIFGAETRLGKAFLIAKQLLQAKEMVMEISKTITFSTQAAARSTVAVAEGTAQTAKVGFPQNIPLLIGYAAQAAGIFGAIRSAVKSAKSSVALPSMPSISEGGMSSSPVSAAPTFNVVGTSGQNQIAQSLGNQAPVKAYVVANDVSSQQSLDRNIVKTAIKFSSIAGNSTTEIASTPAKSSFSSMINSTIRILFLFIN